MLDHLFVIGAEAPVVAEAAVAAGMPPSAVTVVKDRAALARAVVALSRPGDGVLVKASRALGLEVVVDALLAAHPPSSSSPGAR